MQHGATLNGLINTNGFDCSVYFNYGTSPDLGTIVQIPGLFNSTIDIPISVDITDLSYATKYFFQLGVTYENGTIVGEILDFTTPIELFPVVTTLSATNIY